ncbi:MAG: hypothetical protein ABII74_05120 [Elusimicrobiota bacterium]
MLCRKVIIFAILFCFTLTITGPEYLSALRPPLSRENLGLSLLSVNPPTDDELKEIVRNTMGDMADHFQYVLPSIDYDKIYELKTELDKVKAKGKKVKEKFIVSI